VAVYERMQPTHIQGARAIQGSQLSTEQGNAIGQVLMIT